MIEIGFSSLPLLLKKSIISGIMKMERISLPGNESLETGFISQIILGKLSGYFLFTESPTDQSCKESLGRGRSGTQSSQENMFTIMISFVKKISQP